MAKLNWNKCEVRETITSHVLKGTKYINVKTDTGFKQAKVNKETYDTCAGKVWTYDKDRKLIYHVDDKGRTLYLHREAFIVNSRFFGFKRKAASKMYIVYTNPDLPFDCTVRNVQIRKSYKF